MRSRTAESSCSPRPARPASVCRSDRPRGRAPARRRSLSSSWPRSATTPRRAVTGDLIGTGSATRRGRSSSTNARCSPRTRSMHSWTDSRVTTACILVGDPDSSHRSEPAVRSSTSSTTYARRQETSRFHALAQSYAELTIPASAGRDRRRRTCRPPARRMVRGERDEPRRGRDLGPAATRGGPRHSHACASGRTLAELNDVLRAELGDELERDDRTGRRKWLPESYGGTLVGRLRLLQPRRGQEGGGLADPLPRPGNRRRRQRTEPHAAADVPGTESESWPDLKTLEPQKVPKPAGPQEIVYGDKVINVRNKTRTRTTTRRSTDVLEYVANGEIGVITGPTSVARGRCPWAGSRSSSRPRSGLRTSSG